MDTVVEERDQKAGVYARRIGDDISDVLEDSTWENFASGLSTTLDYLGYVATVIAFIAIFCTPAGWIGALLTGLAIGLGVASLLGHTLLAVTGEGSWTDVAMDAFGLVTMGLGARAMSALKAGRALTKVAAKGAARAQTASKVREGQKGVRNFTDRVIARHGADSPRGQMAQRIQGRQDSKLQEEVRGAVRTESRAPMAQGQGIVEKEGRDLAADVKRMDNDWGAGRPAVRQAAEQSQTEYKKFVTYWGAGTGVDVGDKGTDAISSAFDSEGYGDLKDSWEAPLVEVGSKW